MSVFGERKVYIDLFWCVIEDGHSNVETPVPIPNTEAKHATSWVLVSERKRSPDAVFFYFLSPLYKFL